MKASEFYTQQVANDGKEFNLPDPFGKPTGQKITLRHAQSNIGRAGRAIVQAKVPQLLGEEKDPLKRQLLQEDLVAEALSYLVIGWTLDDECTPAAAKDLFVNAPYLIDWADEITSSGEHFFPKASAALLNMPGRGRGSKGQRAKAAS